MPEQGRALEVVGDGALHQDQQRLAAELDTAVRLQSVATQLISTRGTAELFEQILDAARAILRADFASIQMFHPERGTQGELRLLGHRGFSKEAAKRWEWVGLTTPTASGEALRTRQRAVVPDVQRCNFMAGSSDLEAYLSEGIKAVQTTPLVSRSGALLGMIATHWREPHEPAASELRAVDVLARMAADLIERSRAEEALWRSEERFRQIAQSVGEFIWEIDEKGLYTYVSPVVEQLLGYTPEEVVGRHFYDFFPPENREEMKRAVFRAVASRESFRAVPILHVRKDGKIVVMETTGAPILGATGTLLGYRGAKTDITDRKQAEAKLRESEERFRRVFEEGPLGVALVGRDHRFVKVNNAFCQMVGFDEAELVRMSFVDITHPDDVRADVELAEQLFKREIPSFRMQKRYVKKTGEIIWINLTASMIHGPDGEPLHGLAMIEDITEVKRNQEEAIVRQKLESVGTLAGGIAHDFNNLLGAVLAQAELAQAELADGSSPEGELKTIREVAMRGSEIVRQLMIYAGKENQGVDLVDVSEVVEQMLELMKISVSKRAIFKTDLYQNLPSIRATAAQVSQLVMNLVTNASEALGDRDGVIRIATRSVMVGHDSKELHGLAEGEYVQLEVSDTGCGMPPEMRTRIFDPFFSTKAEGRGLGLAVVHGIVKDLGGAINLVSERGHGTTFQILLPFAEAPSDSIRGLISDIDGPVRQSQPATVLVVEDESHLRQPVVQMLRKNGFKVFEAADGSSAIDLIRLHAARIDTILLDMTLPGASSHEIVTEATNAKPDIMVVLTSAYSREMIDGSLSTPQTYSFIRKPFQFEDLVKMLRKSLSS
jgi:PAS domain S-box-containing protein